MKQCNVSSQPFFPRARYFFSVKNSAWCGEKMAMEKTPTLDDGQKNIWKE